MAHGGLERSSRGPRGGSRPLLPMCAERIGATRQTVIAIEQGRYSPALEMAFRIAHVFGVPLDDVSQYPDSPEVRT